MSKHGAGDGAAEKARNPSEDDLKIVKVVCFNGSSFTARKHELCKASSWLDRKLNKARAVPLTPEGASVVLDVPHAMSANMLQHLLMLSQGKKVSYVSNGFLGFLFLRKFH